MAPPRRTSFGGPGRKSSVAGNARAALTRAASNFDDIIKLTRPRDSAAMAELDDAMDEALRFDEFRSLPQYARLDAAALRRAFESADIDSDGAVGRDEFLGAVLVEELAAAGPAVLLKEMDENADGRIDAAEFEAFVGALLAPVMTHLLGAAVTATAVTLIFKAVDTNADGYISLAELEAALRPSSLPALRSSVSGAMRASMRAPSRASVVAVRRGSEPEPTWLARAASSVGFGATIHEHGEHGLVQFTSDELLDEGGENEEPAWLTAAGAVLPRAVRRSLAAARRSMRASVAVVNRRSWSINPGRLATIAQEPLEAKGRACSANAPGESGVAEGAGRPSHKRGGGGGGACGGACLLLLPLGALGAAGALAGGHVGVASPNPAPRIGGARWGALANGYISLAELEAALRPSSLPRWGALANGSPAPRRAPLSAGASVAVHTAAFGVGLALPTLVPALWGSASAALTPAVAAVLARRVAAVSAAPGALTPAWFKIASAAAKTGAAAAAGGGGVASSAPVLAYAWARLVFW